MFEFLANPVFWAGVAAVVAMEVAHGIDSPIFVAQRAAGRTEGQRVALRRLGLVLAAGFRIGLLFLLLWIFSISGPALSLAGWAPDWRALILLAAGAFVAYKAAAELHTLLEGPTEAPLDEEDAGGARLPAVIGQIVLMSAIFSVDSVIIAMGAAAHPEAIVVGLLVALLVLHKGMVPIADTLKRHPSIRALALAALLAVGAILIGEGLGLAPDRLPLYGMMGMAALALAVSLVIGRRRVAAAIGGVVAPAPSASEEMGRAEPEPVEPGFAPAVLLPDADPQTEPSLVLPERLEPELFELETFEPSVSEPEWPAPEPIEAEVSEAAIAREAEEEISVASETELGEEGQPVPKTRAKHAPKPGRAVRRRTGARREKHRS